MEAIAYTEVMNMKDLVARARSMGIDISNYTLRRAISEGKLPCRIIGRTYLISWSNFLSWISCSDGCDNPNFKKI